jgi:hypothetical protein
MPQGTNSQALLCGASGKGRIGTRCVAMKRQLRSNHVSRWQAKVTSSS